MAGIRASYFGQFKLFTFALLGIFLAGCVSTPPAQDVKPKGYSFWPAAPDEPRIQYLVSFNSSLDIAKEQSGFERAVYGESVEAYALNKPYGARLWNGCIYVCDVRAGGVTIMDLRQRQTRIMGATGPTKISKAVDLVIAPDGTKYVIDSVERAVMVFTPQERYRTMYRLGADASPVGIAIFQDRLYVTDFKNALVRVLDRNTGAEIMQIGQRGGEDGQFIGPLGVAVDRMGNVFVSDTIKCRVQKFSPDGAFLLAFGVTGNRPGQFVRPKYMAIGSDDQLHVVDAAFNNVQVFDPEANVVGYYGGPGSFPGAMDLPAGIDVHETDFDLFAKFVHPAFQVERLILVANQFGDQKISVYAMGHLKPGSTVADTVQGRALTAPGMVPSTQPAATTTAPVK